MRDWRRFQTKFKEIWKIDVTYKDSEGHEQKGIRPCLIIREFKESEMILVIPFTSILDHSRFPYTLVIDKDDNNKLEKKSVALVYQIKSLSKSRLKSCIGRLGNNHYNRIKDLIKEIFKI